MDLIVECLVLRRRGKERDYNGEDERGWKEIKEERR